jgi:hypothetical protein
MNRARIVVAATLVGAGLAAGGASAQSQTSSLPPLQPILAGRKITPPVKGDADVEFMEKTPKRDKDLIIQQIDVKNVSSGPIARLTIDETLYDKGGAVVSGGKGTIQGLLQPGEVQTITIEIPYNKNVNSNKYNFSHANGNVKPKRVAKLTAGTAASAEKEPAAKPAASKAPAKKK